jgi:predicted secreted protein
MAGALVALASSIACKDRDAPAASPSAPEGASQAGDAGETVVHVEDDGKTLDVGRGATVTFKLASNAGTGFVWMPTIVNSFVLVQQGDRSSEVSSDAPGARKYDVYHFMAGTAGTTDVEMSLRRPFEDAGSARAIRVTVHVH